MVNVKEYLSMKSFQISLTSAILFLIVANPFIFRHADKFLTFLLGTKRGSNQMIILFFHVSSLIKSIGYRLRFLIYI